MAARTPRLDIDVLRRSVLQGFEVDEQEREEAQHFLKEQEALQARKRERDAAAAMALRTSPGPTDPCPVSMRTKKSFSQKALQDAFRTSFYQMPSAVTASKDESDFLMTAADDAQSTASSRSCSTCDDNDDAMFGRMSRLSLHNDDYEGFVTPTAGSTPTKTQDAFTPARRPQSLYSSSTPTKPQYCPTSAARPSSLYVPSQTPSRTHTAMRARSPSASPRTQDVFPQFCKPSSLPATPKKSPLKTAIKRMQKAASSTVKTALPGYATSKAYKEFRKSVAEENASRTQQDVPPPIPRHGMPHITEEADHSNKDDSEHEA